MADYSLNLPNIIEGIHNFFNTTSRNDELVLTINDCPSRNITGQSNYKRELVDCKSTRIGDSTELTFKKDKLYKTKRSVPIQKKFSTTIYKLYKVSCYIITLNDRKSVKVKIETNKKSFDIYNQFYDGPGYDQEEMKRLSKVIVSALYMCTVNNTFSTRNIDDVKVELVLLCPVMKEVIDYLKPTSISIANDQLSKLGLCNLSRLKSLNILMGRSDEDIELCSNFSKDLSTDLSIKISYGNETNILLSDYVRLIDKCSKLTLVTRNIKIEYTKSYDVTVAEVSVVNDVNEAIPEFPKLFETVDDIILVTTNLPECGSDCNSFFKDLPTNKITQIRSNNFLKDHTRRYGCSEIIINFEEKVRAKSARSFSNK